MLLGGIGTFLQVVAAAIVAMQPPDGPLPPASEIASMRILYEPFRPREFQVSANYFQRIRVFLLSPARVQPEPAKCEGLGVAKIKTHKGEVVVFLYTSDYEIDEKHYKYPDGSYKEVEDAILAAHADALRERP